MNAPYCTHSFVSPPPLLPPPPAAEPAALARTLHRLRCHAIEGEGKSQATFDIIERSLLRWRLGLLPATEEWLTNLQQLFGLWRRMEVAAGKDDARLPRLRADAVLAALPGPPCAARGELSVVVVAECADDAGVVGVRAVCPGCGAVAWIEGESARAVVVSAVRGAVHKLHGDVPFPVLLWETPEPALTWAEEQAARAEVKVQGAAMRARVQVATAAEHAAHG